MLEPRDPRLVALLDSYTRWTHSALATPESLFDAPAVVLAHGVETPPILWYGNRRALELWEMSFAEFTQMPSYRTAEPDCRQARETLLREVEQKGFSTGYRGVRISRSGRRFEIDQATVFNIVDGSGQHIGQAATFDRWRWLDA